MEKEKQKCFNQEGKLNSLIFEGREVSMARIMMTANPVKLIATKDAVYYADGKPSSLTDIEIFELKNNVKQAIAVFNALLAVFNKHHFTNLKIVELNPFYMVIAHVDNVETTYYILKMKNKKVILNCSLDACIIKFTIEEILNSSLDEENLLDILKLLDKQTRILKYLSQINYGMLNVCEKLLSKSSGESVFTVHYDTIDTYTLILKIDMPLQILELNQIPIYTRIENLKIILSKEDENHMIVFTEGPNKVDLSVFYHMVEALPISDYLEFSNNKLKFLGDIHHGESILLDFFSLLLSFMGSYAAIKLNAFLLAYKNKDSQKAVKRTDPVPKVIFIHKSKFDTFTKDNKRVNYHLYSTFYRAAIKKQDSANIFLPEYTYSSIVQQKFSDLITFFSLTEKGYYFSYSYFNALLFELDEYSEYHEIMTKIAKTVRVEVQGNKPENTHNEATQELLTLSHSHIERLTQHPRLGGRTMSNSSFTQTDNPVAAPPVDPLSELKTVIRFQYKKMLEVVYEAYSSKNTEIYINLFEGLVSIKATIYPLHTRGNTYYAIKLQDHELKFTSAEYLTQTIIRQNIKTNYQNIRRGSNEPVGPPVSNKIHNELSTLTTRTSSVDN